MPVVSSKTSSTLTTLLNELRDECLSTIRLIHQLELEHLTDEQMDEVLGELTASVTHLHVHSAMVKEELDRD
jgi:hypothetical protein